MDVMNAPSDMMNKELNNQEGIRQKGFHDVLLSAQICLILWTI